MILNHHHYISCIKNVLDSQNGLRIDQILAKKKWCKFQENQLTTWFKRLATKEVETDWLVVSKQMANRLVYGIEVVNHLVQVASQLHIFKRFSLHIPLS